MGKKQTNKLYGEIGDEGVQEMKNTNKESKKRLHCQQTEQSKCCSLTTVWHMGFNLMTSGSGHARSDDIVTITWYKLPLRFRGSGNSTDYPQTLHDLKRGVQATSLPVYRECHCQGANCEPIWAEILACCVTDHAEPSGIVPVCHWATNKHSAHRSEIPHHKSSHEKKKKEKKKSPKLHRLLMWY